MKRAILFSLLAHAAFFFVGTNQEESLVFQTGMGAIEVSGAPRSEGDGGGAKTSSDDEGARRGDDGVLEGGAALGIASPEYPRMSRLRGEQGEVLLQMHLNEAGELIEAKVLQSSGYPALDGSALAAIQKGLPLAKDAVVSRERKIRFRFRLNP